ncbi:MAG: hypothetical protein U0791_26685 [Gemmataceae bacterium]
MTATLQRPRTAAEPITLRTNGGSHRKVKHVDGYDVLGGVVFVRFEDYPNEVVRVPLDELEALDANRQYVRPVSAVVRSMTDMVFG